MKEIVEKSKCSGCHACFNICPQNAVEMIEDEKTGFKYPSINHDKCIDCGMCKKACPILNKTEVENRHNAYACYNKNLEERKNSSSGGIFILLAKYIISQNGVVFGASFDENLNVIHTCADGIEDINKFMGSKYVQSTIGESYKKAKEFLDNGRIVYFSGTPCQIEGLKSYLGKDYSNLYTQDIICHGVPSPKVWNIYLKYRNKEERPSNINFRDKDNGWAFFNLKIKYINNVYIKNHNEDLYMKSFLKNYSLRESCYNCSFKKYYRNSDITLADFWGVNKLCPEMYDKYGTSLVIVSSDKGRELLNRIDENIVLKEVDFDSAVNRNIPYTKSVKMPNDREMFFDDLDKLEFDSLINKYIKKPSLVKRILGKVKKFLQQK